MKMRALHFALPGPPHQGLAAPQLTSLRAASRHSLAAPAPAGRDIRGLAYNGADGPSSNGSSFPESPFEPAANGVPSSSQGLEPVHRNGRSADPPPRQNGSGRGGNGASQHSVLSRIMPGDSIDTLRPLESLDAADLWLDVADAVFPKEAAKLEQVAGRPGTRQKQRRQDEEGTPAAQPPPPLPMLEAAPACMLELPQEPNEADIWACIRREAAQDAAAEPMLSSFINAAVCSQPGFASSAAFVLAHRLADVNEEDEMTTMFGVFADVLSAVLPATLADLVAVRTRDEACSSMALALMHHGGFHSLQLQRVAHALWESGDATAALRIQSLTSRALGADLHPAAKFGKGVYIAHPLGIVVGEAAVVGNGVTIMQHVTLGGTGAEAADRHPKIGDHVQIGVKATILGNIKVGRRARVAAGSMVLKPVEADMLVAGNPAKVVGKLVDVHPCIPAQGT